MDNKDNELAKLAGNEGFVSMDRILALQAEAKSRAAGAAKGGENEGNDNSAANLASQSQAAQPSIDTPEFRKLMAEHWKANGSVSANRAFHAVIAYIDSHLAGQSQATKVQAVPEGWKLVPIESTGKMDKAGRDALRNLLGDTAMSDDAEACYRAMIATAPQAPTAQEVTQQAMSSPPFAAPAGQHDAEPWVLEAVLATYLLREMPEGTVIGNPAWWASRIAANLERALPGRFRAQGGITNTDGSNLAPTTSTATASGSGLPTNDEVYAEVNRLRDMVANNRYVSTNAVNDTMQAVRSLVSASAQASQAASAVTLEEALYALDLVTNKMNVPGLSGQRGYAKDVLLRASYNDALRTNPATPASKGDS